VAPAIEHGAQMRIKIIHVIRVLRLDSAFPYELVIFSQKNFLILNKCIHVVKINNKRKLKYYLNDYDSGNISQKAAAKFLGITPRRFKQINEIYKSTGDTPVIGLELGRPGKEVPEEWKEIIKQEI
jgi:hypothetical protein